jgi:hypothetical protein
MHKLNFIFHAIGDQICTTALPENIYNVTGEKSVITDKRIWAFKHNPYVEFMEENEAKGLKELVVMPDARIPEQRKAYEDMMKSVVYNSQTEYMCVNMNFNDVRLRHPRLYIYEDTKQFPNRVVVHTTGADRTKDGEAPFRANHGEDSVRTMSDEVIASILKNYDADTYELIQIGGKTDKPLGGHSKDFRGMGLWQTAEMIATSARYIGVNSGFMHMANCYPRVDKRIVLQEFHSAAIQTFKPGDTRFWGMSWFDPTSTFFNKYNVDVGVSYTHTKI